MKVSGGFQQSYNTQVAVDGKSRIIVANGVTQSAADVGQLRPLLDGIRTNTGRTPQRVLADAGYASEKSLRSLQRRRIDGYVAQGRGETPTENVASSPERQKMHEKLKTKSGQKQYRKRKHIAEPPFGWIKSVLNFRSFSLQGHVDVKAEWNLVCLALNLKRLNAQMMWSG